MSKMKFKLNRNGVKELMQSPEMQGVMAEHASRVRNNAGEGYGYDTRVGKTRANAMVFPVTKEAYADNLENNTLLKALR